MGDPWQECTDYAVVLARQAGEMIREALKTEMNVMIKSSPADLVTVTDQKVEKMLMSSIKEKYSYHGFIGEESVAAGEKTVLTEQPTWIIDPIDGATNFVHRAFWTACPQRISALPEDYYPQGHLDLNRRNNMVVADLIGELKTDLSETGIINYLVE
ncbi:inositol monophosphatase 1-like isoform X1 [Apodemus sylvaticus]|uniref:inositol monophosphatase 1-like isoform X1 n=2 Tax=Apodemus sylvaticus TaxID=10129 RepID=UPI002244E987|nr:inositol monophosphatase 1-like isoform X1 [Apodemus sylvaticus]